MAVAKIMLIAEPPAGPKVRDHLSEYADTALVRTKDFTTVHIGTEWVLVMNGGPRGGAIFDAAKKAGAHAVAVSPSWSQMQATLERAGFFKAFAAPAARPLPPQALTHRPFTPAKLVAATITIPVNPTPETHVAQPTAVPQPPEPLPPMTPADANKSPERMAVLTEIRVEKAQEKLEILRGIFKRNPSATTAEAQAALRALSPDGAGLSNDKVVALRREVRVSMSLPPDGPRAHVPYRSRRPAVQSATPPPPSQAPILPADVDAAARLLKDALEASAGVLDFTLTFRKGGGARVMWQPLNTATLEL